MFLWPRWWFLICITIELGNFSKEPSSWEQTTKGKTKCFGATYLLQWANDCRRFAFYLLGTAISLDKCAHYHRMCSLSALRSIDAGTLLPAPWPFTGHKVGYFMNATWQPMDRQKDNKHVAAHSHRIPIRIRLWLGRNSNLLQRIEERMQRERERRGRLCVWPLERPLRFVCDHQIKFN